MYRSWDSRLMRFLLAAAAWLACVAPRAIADDDDCGCGCDDERPDQRVAAVEPPEDAKDAPTDTRISVTLKVEIDPEVLETGMTMFMVFRSAGGIPREAVEGKMSYDEKQRRVVFTPKESLQPGKEYSVNVMIVVNAMKGDFIKRQWMFRTAKAAAAAPKPPEAEGKEPKGSGAAPGSKPPEAGPAKAPEREQAPPANTAAELAEARKLLAAGDYEAANDLLAAVLGRERQNAEARFLYAEARLRWAYAAPRKVPSDLQQLEALGVPLSADSYLGDHVYSCLGHVLYACTTGSKIWADEFSREDSGFRIATFKGLVSFVAAGGGVDPNEASTWLRVMRALQSSRDVAFDLPRDAKDQLACQVVQYCRRKDPSWETRLQSAIFEQVYTGTGSSSEFEAILASPDASPAVKCPAAVYLGAIRSGYDAEKYYIKALSFDRDCVEAKLGQAMALTEQQKLERSNKLLESLMAEHPDLDGAYYCLSRNQEYAKDEKGAADTMEKGAKATKDAVAYWTAYADLLMAREREAGHGQLVARVIAALRRAAEARPADPELWHVLGSYCYATQKYRQALAAVEKEVALGRTGKKTWLLLAELRRRDGDTARCLECVDQVLKGDPADEDAWRTIRLAAQEWGAVSLGADEISALLAEKRRAFGDMAAASCEEGYLHALEGHFDKAAEAYVRALKVDPTKATVRASLLDVGQVLGKSFEQLYDAVLTIDPTQALMPEVKDELAAARRRAADRRSRWSGWLPARGAYGGNPVAGDVYDSMRDWQADVSGQLGALGLMFD